jgi:hypothetical protein
MPIDGSFPHGPRLLWRGCALGAACALGFAGNAGARSRPSIRVATPEAVDAGQPFTVGIRGSRLSGAVPLSLQARRADVDRWQKVASLEPASRFYRVPGLGMGSYRLRVVSTRPHGNVVSRPSRPVHAFKRIPLSKLVATPGGVFESLTDGSPFAWAVDGHPGLIEGAPSPSHRLLDDLDNACRALHVDFTAGHTVQSAYVRVAGASSPAQATTETGVLGSVDAQLTPGRRWSLVAATTASSVYVYVNGDASCYSARQLATP